MNLENGTYREGAFMNTFWLYPSFNTQIRIVERVMEVVAEPSFMFGLASGPMMARVGLNLYSQPCLSSVNPSWPFRVAERGSMSEMG